MRRTRRDLALAMLLFVTSSCGSQTCMAMLLLPALRVVLPHDVLDGATSISGCVDDKCVPLERIAGPGALTDGKADPDAVWGAFENGALRVGKKVSVQLVVVGSLPFDVRGTPPFESTATADAKIRQSSPSSGTQPRTPSSQLRLCPRQRGAQAVGLTNRRG